MASGQQKMNPRKFSEKIALLNKKEVEGNAEFEEIIKEVQATRSRSAYSNASATSRSSNKRIFSNNRATNDELEEVFENLIKCVGQYEQELQESPVHYGSSSISAKRQFDETDKSTRSASAEVCNRYTPSSLVQPDSSPHNQPPGVSLTTATYDDMVDFQHGLSFGGDSYAHQDASIRARVTSFGSANNCNIRPNNYQQSKYYQNQDNWIVCNDMYLKPTCDKYWQKSSSDPALHAPCAAINENDSLSSGATIDDSSKLANCVILDEQQENVGPGESSKIFNILQDGNKFGCLDEQNAPVESNCLVKESQYSQDHAELIDLTQQPHFISPPNLVKTSNSIENDHYNNPNETRNNLPGIKICTIDDESPHSNRGYNNCQITLNKDNALTDAYNSQFTMLSSMFDQPIDAMHMTQNLNSREKIFNNNQEWAICKPLSENSIENVHHLEPSNIQPINWCKAENQTLYAPTQVNNLLSNSECGLTDQGLDFKMNSCNSMNRSHSHSNIEYLTKQRSNYYTIRQGQQQNGPLNRCHHHHQYDPYNVAHFRSYQSNSSMRPQHGSISPIDSSSNLASPQSEQNSPGSSTTDYGEYLPFARTSNLTLTRKPHEFLDDNADTISSTSFLNQSGQTLDISTNVSNINTSRQVLDSSSYNHIYDLVM